MDQPTITDWLQLGAASLTMLAAFAAVVIAKRAPKLAAEWAEKYRRQSEQASDKERLQMHVFVSLMKCRAQILHSEAISALNLIDAAFVDNVQVRAAYRSFIEATEEVPSNAVRIVERYHAVIEKVAGAVGFAELIGPHDVRLGYYPLVLGRLDEATLAQAEETIARRNNPQP